MQEKKKIRKKAKKELRLFIGNVTVYTENPKNLLTTYISEWDIIGHGNLIQLQ